mgnify:CR=1 FL=1
MVCLLKDLLKKLIKLKVKITLQKKHEVAWVSVAAWVNKNPVEVGERFKLHVEAINIDELDIDLIDKINPFQRAYEILSKSVTKQVLKLIRDTIEATRIEMTFEEAKILWPKVNEFVKTYEREPDINSLNPIEKRYAETIIYLKSEQRNSSTDG